MCEKPRPPENEEVTKGGNSNRPQVPSNVAETRSEESLGKKQK